MKKPQNSRIDNLSVRELEALLQEELAREEKDYVLIHQILERLKAKSTALPEVTQEEVDEAMLTMQESKIVPKEKQRPTLWRKPLLAVAAVFCVVLLAVPMVSGTAFVQELIAKWNDKLFWIESPGSPVETPEDYVFQTDNPGLQQLYDAVTELGITAPVVPMWLPDGFELEFFDISQYKNGAKITAYFQNNDDEIAIYVERKIDQESTMYKNEVLPKNWTFMGIKHYYVENTEHSTVIWSSTNYEASITASLSKNYLYRITKSIYLGKEE